MKKRILGLAIVSLLALFLAGCESKKIFSDSKLDNYTAERKINDVTDYTLQKDGSYYKMVDQDGNESYYIDFGDETYEYKQVTETVTEDDETTEEDETVTNTYVTSEVTSIDLSSLTDSLLSISLDDLTKNDDGSYSFKELEENSLLSPFMDDVWLDDVTELKEGYTRGLIVLNSAVIYMSDGTPTSLVMTVTYADSLTTITYSFSSFGSTDVDVYKESYLDKDYVNYLKDGSPVVTIKFVGYGEVKVQLFSQELQNLNAVYYFIYLFKNYFYSGIVVDSEPDSEVFFGTSKKTPAKTIDTSDNVVANTRGILSMVIATEDDDDNTVYTTQLFLNLEDNSSTYDDSGYLPIGGVIEGFDVLDAIAGLSDSEYADVKVKISIQYNGFSYEEPTFSD